MGFEGISEIAARVPEIAEHVKDAQAPNFAGRSSVAMTVRIAGPQTELVATLLYAAIKRVVDQVNSRKLPNRMAVTVDEEVSA